jgi:hypothetical protein
LNDTSADHAAIRRHLAKWRTQSTAALVVHDSASADPWRGRFLEIRGTAAAIRGPGGRAGLTDEALIRIHPTRILSLGIEEPREPHLTMPPAACQSQSADAWPERNPNRVVRILLGQATAWL